MLVFGKSERSGVGERARSLGCRVRLVMHVPSINCVTSPDFNEFASQLPAFGLVQKRTLVQTSQSMSDLQIPLQPSSPLTQGYQAAFSPHRQPLCGNNEGWGPFSPYRFDFTPCFLDVWVASVAVFGILGGAGALWYFFKKCTEQPVKKNWHFYAKLVCYAPESAASPIID